MTGFPVLTDTATIPNTTSATRNITTSRKPRPMTSTSRSVGRRLGLTVAVSPVSLLVPPAALSTLTWLTATNPVSLPAFLSSYAILQIAWGSYVPWSRRPRGLPIFSIIAFIYWIFFAAALFWGERRIFARHFVPI